MTDTPYISLTLGDYNFVISTIGYPTFVDQSVFPRLRMEREATEISDFGAFVDYASAYEDPHMFDFSVLVPMAIAPKFQALYDEYRWRVRQKNPTTYSPDILLVDAFQPYEERSPNTRATAPTPFNTLTYSGSGSSLVQYFAQFYVRFIKRPEFKPEGAYAIVHLNLQETERKVAP